MARSGSVTEGAALIHRSQSAASIQIKRMDDIPGKPVFERHGRGVALNETGRKLLLVAQDVTAQLDAIQRELSDGALQGKIRLGIPDDHGRERLTRIMADFARRQPQVEIDVTCSDSTKYPGALRKHELDLALCDVEAPEPHKEVLFKEPTCRVSSVSHDFRALDILPVALFDRCCWWRDAAFAAPLQNHNGH